MAEKDDLVARLRLQAKRSSDIARQMAEAKSLRQEGNAEGRTDLYMWPTPEQTIEGRAADFIEHHTRIEPEAADRGEAWQPIETAPKDGTLFIAYSQDLKGCGLTPFVSACGWHNAAGFCTDEIREPTHWMPFSAITPPAIQSLRSEQEGS